MNRSQRTFWRSVRQRLQANESLVLWVVAASWGSSPGKSGFMMSVAHDGSIVGTVGGGIMERQLIDRSPNLAEPILLKRVHQANALDGERSGMVCSGGQWLIGVPLAHKHLSDVENLLELSESGERVGIAIDSQGFRFCRDPKSIFVHNQSLDFQYTSAVSCVPTLYVLGGGHVGQAIARQFALLDFRVFVIDDRNDAPAMLEDCADVKQQCPFSHVGTIVDQGALSYVAVVTRAMDTDTCVLKSLLNQSFAYLGLMGSRSKIKRIFRTLTEQGADPEWLKSIHAPLGLSIVNHTPAEIAVSAAAQIIDVWHKSSSSL